MKLNKVFLIIQSVCMYLSQLPLWGILYLAIFDRNSELGNNLGDIFGLIFRIGNIITFAISFIHIPITLIRRKNQDFSKTTMILKLIQIPWYVINYFFCILVFLGLCNPFLFMAIPLFLLISVLFTYTYMLSTSLPEFISYLKMTSIKKELKSAIGIISCVALLFFVIDVPGAILIYCITKSKDNEINNVIR